MLEGQLRAEPAPPILDCDYLDGLRRYLGTPQACELLADGMLELVGRLDRLSELADAGESGEVAALAHEIVGAAGHLGLSLIAHYAALASQAARRGDASAWVRAVQEVRSDSIGRLRDYCAAFEGEARA
jgi:HPt (histidine-containing phosphotransfer) domain-containing protein